MIGNRISLHGYNTKIGARLLSYPAKQEGGEERHTAWLTLAVKRGYQVTVDGKKQDATDFISLKFLNSSAKSIAQYIPEGTVRRLNIVGTLTSYQDTDTREGIFTKNTDGTLVHRPLLQVVNGVSVPLKHEVKVDKWIVEVHDWEFLDPKPEGASSGVVVSSDEGIVIDMSMESETVVVSSNKSTPTSQASDIPAFEPEVINPGVAPANF